MKTASSNKHFYWEIGLTALFVAVILLLFPVWSQFQVDPDEGVNLGKAMLLEKGYSLYSDIWSDQPPVLTYILAGLIRVFENDVAIPRITIVLFSAMLVGLSFRILNSNASLGAALIATVLMIVTDPFIRVSYAVMIGLPAISMALLSLFAIMQWHKSARYAWLVLSAVVLALSVMTKLFTGLLAPIFFLGLLYSDFKNQEKETALWKNFLPTLTWTIVFTLLLAVIIWFAVGFENFIQLISPHLDARELKIFQSRTFSTSPYLLLLSGIGILFIVQDRKWLFLYPIAWMIVSLILLLYQRPVWYHQALLFTVPAILIAAYAANEGLISLVTAFRDRLKASWRVPRNYLGLAAFVFFLAFLNEALPPKYVKDVSLPPKKISKIQKEAFDGNQKMTMSAIKDYARETEWLLTDRPMFAYRTGLLMPPNTAAITGKRFFSGHLTEKEIIETIQNFSPEQIILGRYEYEDVFEFLSEDYTLLPYSEDKNRHFVLNEWVE